MTFPLARLLPINPLPLSPVPSPFLQVFTALVNVFGRAPDGNHWGFNSCITLDRYQDYVDATAFARPWVTTITWAAMVNDTDR